MKLGKQKRTLKARMRDNEIISSTVPSYRRNYHPLRASVDARPRLGHEACVRCDAQECEEPDGFISTNQTALRIRLGYVVYRPFGSLFLRAFNVYGRTEEAFIHTLCAMEGGMELEAIRDDLCCLCKKQFFCVEEPKETVVWIEHGQFDDNGEYNPTSRGAVHWACAMHWWGEEITTAFVGPE